MVIEKLRNRGILNTITSLCKEALKKFTIVFLHDHQVLFHNTTQTGLFY